MIKLSEPLHVVYQGEGIHTQKKMILLRTSGCNVQCISCDSKHSWDTVDNEYIISDLTRSLRLLSNESDINHIMITGGNPELQKEELIKLINNMGIFYFDIEVPGLVPWGGLYSSHNIQFNFSPKIGALENKNKKFEYKAFENLPQNYIIKVVVSEDDFDNNILAIEDLMEKYKIPIDKIYLMPMGTTREEIIKGSQFLMQKCLEIGFNFTTRLHVLLFDNKKLV